MTAAKTTTKTPRKRRTPIRGKTNGAGKKKAKPKKKTTTTPTKTKATKPEPKTGVDASTFTQRQIANAVKSLTSDERVKLYTDLTGNDLPRNTKGVVTITTVKLGGIIAKAILKAGTLPPIVAKAIKPKRERSSGPAAPKRIDLIVGLLKRKGGATIDEMADEMLKTFPTMSGRWGGGAADRSRYVVFARAAVSHLKRGTNFKIAKETAGKVQRSDDGKYSITE